MTVYVLISKVNCGYEGTETNVLCASVDLSQIRKLAEEKYRIYGTRNQLEIEEYIDGVETSNYVPIKE
jgi:hypothetical protein